ncbi:MAG TPA: SDR family NAD(P)-dependent oxidoreductase [Thermoplasmata archaeon]|nr:SDR family NAD(P)-dependent oxidoreductase [Thermoplasmata archaeon]
MQGPSSGRFREKGAVVTGASRGIGRAIAHALAAEGFHLLLVARDREALERVRGEIHGHHGSVETLELDLTAPAAASIVARVAGEALKEPYLLVNNAGSLRSQPFDQRPIEEIDHELTLDLVAPIRLTHALLPALRARRAGHVVHLGSAIVDVPLLHNAVYVSAKTGLQAFSTSLDRELQPHGIRSTVLEPIFVRTDLGCPPGETEGPIRAIARRHPRWVIEPEAVAAACVRALYRPRPIVRVPAAWAVGRPLVRAGARLGRVPAARLDAPPR